MRFRTSILLFLLWASAAGGQTLTISAAISLKETVGEIGSGFTRQTGVTLLSNFGASGVLAAQIEEGAPVDCFLSAGNREMDQLQRQGMIDPSTRRAICRNEVVLIVPADAAFVPGSFNELVDPRIGHIAIGQPATVPAGQYAMEVLTNLKIAHAVASRLIYSQNVRQVLTYVSKDEVDAGIVYATDAIAAGGTVRVAARADASMHSPIVYPAAVVRTSSHGELARRFLDYLQGSDARQVLIRRGFLVDEPATRPAP
jgi:molybdate transport system substrate-binding protein